MWTFVTMTPNVLGIKAMPISDAAGRAVAGVLPPNRPMKLTVAYGIRSLSA